MRTFFSRRIPCVVGILALLLGVAAVLAPGPSSFAQQRTFPKKDCLDCHKKFSEKYFPMKSVHPGNKDGKCEQCHLRHGLVPKLLLKKQGNDVCFSCHAKEKIGMNKSRVHTALKTGKCTACHNPHASQGSHLLTAEGPEACYKCHKKENFEKKDKHPVLGKDGCRACHVAHGSDLDSLLVKAMPPLCLSCHDPGKGGFRKAHGNYPVEKSSCATCHNPHA